ncbi:MAG: hypothetical protein AAF078_02145 [Planctomycetota bacterium]
MLDQPIAYLTQGTLVLKHPGGEAKPYESYFAEQVARQNRRSRQQQGWRQSPVWGVMNGAPMGFDGLAVGAGAENHTPTRITSVGRGRGGPLFVLQTPTICGLFHHEFQDDGERRLIHRQDFQAADPVQHADGTIAMTLRFNDGSACLATCDGDGRRLGEITEGDAVDELPAWCPGEGRRLVYQSAGIARDAQGGLGHLSPYRIESLDLDTKSVETLAEDEASDLLQPRMDAEGNLYFIRRPYQAKPDRPWTETVKDAALMPFRLAVGVFWMLDFLAKAAAGKGLTTAGGPDRRGPNLPWMVLSGRMVQVREEETKAGREDHPVVPKTWELIRRTPDGSTETVAEHVVSYDLLGGGGVVYSDGRSVRRIDPTGAAEVVTRDRLIERVVAC